MIRFARGSFILAGLLAATCAAGSIKRSVFADLERKLDQRLERAVPEDAFLLLGNTRGYYLEKYGAVFTAEINLLNTPSISPFRQTMPKADIDRVHQRKLQRVPMLKKHMRDALLAIAATLDDVPPGEQIAVGISLFYFSWEDTSGLPAQVLMQAERRKLIDAQAGRADAEQVIQVREF